MPGWQEILIVVLSLSVNVIVIGAIAGVVVLAKRAIRGVRK